MGHMLGDTVRDTFARWHRMRGDATLWFPGVDHAGLSTQVEVRRRLAKQGVSMEALSRPEILQHVEAWKREHEARILVQERAGGFSIDWSRYRYTFDEGAQRATKKAFVALYNEGAIYRGERIVNWDPQLRTAVSDLEVLHTEEPAELLYVRYDWADGSPGGLVVATVRPETIFGDVGVAVHPEDERHRADVGRKVRVPLTDRVVPVVTDPLVDPEFGNGALKITPRHDLVDWQIYQHHPELGLPPSILSDQAVLEGSWVPEPFRGLERDAARKAVTEALGGAGQVDRSEKIVHSVGRSERSHAVIEPMLSKQWFVRVAGLVPPTIEAVRSGTIRIHPPRWDLTFFRWMEALDDWCISRQVVWGHPIPVYYCDACGADAASEEPLETCPKCGGHRLTPDPDVLDTWFTSWMWPFLALGWPEPTADLAHYYPASLLVTGRDIMFFWVARMMMAGYRFQGKPPFSDVLFTGMLRDETGRKMSKHLGNSPDPVEVIREWGADAMRFALVFPNPVDQDAAFGEGTLEGGRNFLTKLWNLTRFATSYLPPGTSPTTGPPTLHADSALENRWVLSRWSRMSAELDAALGEFELTRAATLLYQFLWHDLADRYVELAKDGLNGARGEPLARECRETLAFILDRLLRQLHPIVPHVTEELWHALPHEGDSLSVAAWPRPEEAPRDPEAEVAVEVVLEAIRALRNLRAESHIAAAERPPAGVLPAGPEAARLLLSERATIVRIARVESLDVLAPGQAPPPTPARAVSPKGEFYLVLRDAGAAGESLERERAKLQALLDKTRARLADPGFRDHAPAAVVAEAEAKSRELEERIQKIAANLALIPPPRSEESS
jgi:valyl-tRNA synthetase